MAYAVCCVIFGMILLGGVTRPYRLGAVYG